MQTVIKTITRLFRRYNEVLLFPLSVLAFVLAGEFIQTFSPSSGVDDLGWYHRLFVAASGTFACFLTAWVMLRFSFPNVIKFLYDDLGDLLYKTEIPEKQFKHTGIRLAYACFLLLCTLWVFISLLNAIR